MPFFRNTLWCFAWSDPFHLRCACEQCTTNIPFSEVHVLRHLKGIADVCRSFGSSFMKLLRAPSVSCSSPFSCLLFSSKASTGFLRNLCGALQCSHMHTILELLATTTLLLCNLLTKGKSPAISSNLWSVSSRCHQLCYVIPS